MLEGLVQQLVAELGMEKPVAVEPGHYQMEFSPQVDVDIFQKNETLLLQGKIHEVDLRTKPSLVERLMQANLFGSGTRGGTIGWEPVKNRLTLSLELSYNCPYKLFTERLEDFVSVIVFWRTEVTQI